MSLGQLIIGWFYYGIFYMGLSIAATLMINRAVKKLWLSPLLINALAILILLGSRALNLIPESSVGFSIYFVYMPIVVASVFCNLVIGLYRHYQKSRAFK
ncbi:hypothetical protein [Granulicatella seriolae]|uniref:Uncharacterized protein n=1 Tax=Granulicatella seriolae TaxID=2967226 RepID=A0ABT1WLQ2_9LACT|nr:hypothetical protein [Granulicatella seriolae]